VIGHHGCGMSGLKGDAALDTIESKGIDHEKIETLMNAGIDLKKWLTGFESVEDNVRQSVEMIKNHPLLPEYALVHGLVICPETGELEIVSEDKE
jgi:carbonic anhydrase